MTDEKKIVRSRDVKFLNTFRPGENCIELAIDPISPPDPIAEQGEVPKSSPELIKINVPVEESVETSADEEPVFSSLKRGPERPRKMKTGKTGRPRKQYNMVPADSDDVGESENEVAGLIRHLDPASTEEALADPSAEEWNNAILEEYAAHISNRTWEIVDYPPSRKPIGSRFVLKTKLKANGDIERRKARLVAKGYAQRPGTDFQDTFAPVVRTSSIRMLMALSAEWNLTVHQMDVVTAYLHGEVEEELALHEYTRTTRRILVRNREQSARRR